MKKLSRLVLIAALFGLVACGSDAIKVDARKEVDFNQIESNNFTPTTVTGELGNFDLVSPYNGAIGESFTEFSWEACENAKSYTLEVCSSELFISNNSGIDYYSRGNITTTSFKIHSSFIFRDQTYFWRVTAHNDEAEDKRSTTTFSFFIKAPEYDEVELPLGDADDWQLHSLGCRADVSVDNNNFFGNDKESIVFTFKGEDTAGKGWIILTKTVEKNTHGTDALFLNLFYAGQDAQVYIRVIDRDNEYWVAPVQLSNNAKQAVFLKFDEFTQRTKDVYVGNETFDHERIKYIEVVFEKTFGDGVFLLSDVKAVKFDNYENLFIRHLNLNDYYSYNWTYENYQFEREEVSNDEFKIKYYGKNDDKKPVISGWGFAKLNVNRYFAKGDAVKFTAKVLGGAFSNMILRIYEEDTDRWSYKIPFDSIDVGSYQTFVIPFKAFAKSSIMGDGKRQFYYIFNLQFGLEGANKTTGSISFKDFEIISLEQYKKDNGIASIRTVDDNGLIENFENYKFNTEMYYVWDTTVDNKDEYLSLNNEKNFNTDSEYVGQFEYKADMEDAKYTLPVDAKDTEYTSIKFMMKDDSILNKDPRYSQLKNASPDVFISIVLTSGELYQTILVSISRYWTEYDISFSDFYLSNGQDLIYKPVDLKSSAIESISISFKFYYFNYMGKADPTYTDDNKVYIDDIYLSNAEKTVIEAKEHVVHNVDGISMVDDFESYLSTSSLEETWLDGRTFDYQEKELSQEVSSQGGKNSAKFKFLARKDSPSYYISPTIGEEVQSKGIKLSLKCDVKATVYINFYILIGTNTMQYRATLSSIEASWYEYSIGLGNFKDVNNSSRAFTYHDIGKIYRISIGMVYSGGEEEDVCYLYADNIAFDDALTNQTFTREEIK